MSFISFKIHLIVHVFVNIFHLSCVGFAFFTHRGRMDLTRPHHHSPHLLGQALPSPLAGWILALPTVPPARLGDMHLLLESII